MSIACFDVTRTAYDDGCVENSFRHDNTVVKLAPPCPSTRQRSTAGRFFFLMYFLYLILYRNTLLPNPRLGRKHAPIAKFARVVITVLGRD